VASDELGQKDKFYFVLIFSISKERRHVRLFIFKKKKERHVYAWKIKPASREGSLCRITAWNGMEILQQ
jgi:hypothetical protein